MANIAVMLKNEISRLSRTEVRKEVQSLRKATAGYRREIAALKRAIASLERRSKQMAKRAASASAPPVTSETPTRFVAKGLVSLRKRLGLSAAELARLLGVSMQSVYNWEHKKATPRKEQVAAIVALRPLGKKEARQRLDTFSEKRDREAPRRRRTKRKA
jgi:DNA-binding transcriptional regulator YiaG